MADRTAEQLIDQMTYALSSLYQHYGPGFNEEGLIYLREQMTNLYNDTRVDLSAEYRVDTHDDDRYADFHQRVIAPDGWWVRSFEDYLRDIQQIEDALSLSRTAS